MNKILIIIPIAIYLIAMLYIAYRVNNIKNTINNIEDRTFRKLLLYLAFNTSKIVIAFNFLEIIESFFPRTPRVKNAVGTCIQASSTQPSPRLYAIPGPPINELAPT